MLLFRQLSILTQQPVPLIHQWSLDNGLTGLEFSMLSIPFAEYALSLTT